MSLEEIPMEDDLNQFCCIYVYIFYKIYVKYSKLFYDSKLFRI